MRKFSQKFFIGDRRVLTFSIAQYSAIVKVENDSFLHFDVIKYAAKKNSQFFEQKPQKFNEKLGINGAAGGGAARHAEFRWREKNRPKLTPKIFCVA